MQAVEDSSRIYQVERRPTTPRDQDFRTAEIQISPTRIGPGLSSTTGNPLRLINFDEVATAAPIHSLAVTTAGRLRGSSDRIRARRYQQNLISSECSWTFVGALSGNLVST